MDLNGDGYIGGIGKHIHIRNIFLLNYPFIQFLGYMSMLERMTGRDINGDGYIGRRPDVVPGFPVVYGYPSLVYGPGGHIYSTTNFVSRFQ